MQTTTLAIIVALAVVVLGGFFLFGDQGDVAPAVNEASVSDSVDVDEAVTTEDGDEVADVDGGDDTAVEEDGDKVVE